MEWNKAGDMPLSLKEKLTAEIYYGVKKIKTTMIFVVLLFGVPSLLFTFIYNTAFLMFVMLAGLMLLTVPFLGNNAKKKLCLLEEEKFLWREDVVSRIIWSKNRGRKVFGADNTLYYVQSSMMKFREGTYFVGVKYNLTASATASRIGFVVDPIAYCID